MFVLKGELAQSYQKKKIILITEKDVLLPDLPEVPSPLLSPHFSFYFLDFINSYVPIFIFD